MHGVDVAASRDDGVSWQTIATDHPSTSMVPVAADVQVDVLDARGRLVRRLVRGTVEPGNYALDWDRRDAHGTLAPRGVYFVRARIGSFGTQRKVVAL